MEKYKLGSLVEMTARHAKWTLNHLDIYERSGGLVDTPQLDTSVQLCLMQLIGVPVTGKITGYGANEDRRRSYKYVRVLFKMGKLKYEAYYSAGTDVKLV